MDTKIAGNWYQADSDDRGTVISKIALVDCSTVQAIHLQTKIALSTTKEKYIVLSIEIQKVILVVRVLKDIHKAMDFETCKATLTYLFFQNNNGGI